MKTNKFEDTIRRKLESIEPDFQEKDWDRMQNYMHIQNPPTFWQQHSSWIGYAAAASVSTVMAFMYVSQRNQNNMLTADVKNLQHQIEAIKNAPALSEKQDTVYLIKKNDGSDELVAVNPKTTTRKQTLAANSASNELDLPRTAKLKSNAVNNADRIAMNNPELVSNANVPASPSFFINNGNGSGIAGNNDGLIKLLLVLSVLQCLLPLNSICSGR